MQDEVAIFVEGFIIQPFTTHQVFLGDKVADEETLNDPRWTSFNAYANVYGDTCRFEVLTNNRLVQDVDLEEVLI